LNEKKTGSFYTPEAVVQFMIRFLHSQGQSFQRVLEPAAGDGRFLTALPLDRIHVDAVELFEDKVCDMSSRITAQSLHYFSVDFLDYVNTCRERYDLIIGNPP